MHAKELWGAVRCLGNVGDSVVARDRRVAPLGEPPGPEIWLAAGLVRCTGVSRWPFLQSSGGGLHGSSRGPPVRARVWIPSSHACRSGDYDRRRGSASCSTVEIRDRRWRHRSRGRRDVGRGGGGCCRWLQLRRRSSAFPSELTGGRSLLPFGGVPLELGRRRWGHVRRGAAGCRCLG